MGMVLFAKCFGVFCQYQTIIARNEDNSCSFFPYPLVGMFCASCLVRCGAKKRPKKLDFIQIQCRINLFNPPSGASNEYLQECACSRKVGQANMNQKHIYLVFTKTGTWLSKLISSVSQIYYPHVSLSFDDSFSQMYSFGRINPKDPLSAGFVTENLYEGVYKNSPSCECLIYKIAVNEEQYLFMRQRISRFIQMRGYYHYNMLGLFGVLFNKPIKRKRHYFCSQFVSEVLMDGNVLITGKVPELVSTSDLLALEHKEKVYEGFIFSPSPGQYPMVHVRVVGGKVS